MKVLPVGQAANQSAVDPLQDSSHGSSGTKFRHKKAFKIVFILISDKNIDGLSPT